MKQIVTTAFDPAGNQLIRWTDAPPPTFSAAVSAGHADLPLKLPRIPGSGSGLVDDYGGHLDVLLGNRVDYLVYDRETVTTGAMWGSAAKYGTGVLYGAAASSGRLLYRGIIDEISPTFGVGQESVDVLLTSAAKYIGNAFIDSITWNPVDPAVAAKNIIQTYVPGCTWAAGNPGTSSPPFSTALTFTQVKVQDALEALRLLAGLNWYWTVLADGSVRFDKSNVVTPDHIFVVGRHVKTFKPTTSQYRKKAKVVFYGDPGLHGVAGYPATATGADYSSTDPRILVEAYPQVASLPALQQMANTRLLEVDRVDWRAQATIYDSNASPGSLPPGVGAGYDIESIIPGQTCQFIYPTAGPPAVYGGGVLYGSGVRYGAASQSGARQVFVIASVNYETDRVSLELGSRQANVLRTLAATQNQLLQRLGQT